MQFQTLDEYYEYLENDTSFQFLDLNTYKYLTKLRDKIEDEKTKKLCSYEMFFADFSIENGIHVPQFQSGANVYPSLEIFDDNFEYIKIRAKQIQNHKYKAKYNHLLWLSPKKNIEFAKQAIESYLSLLENSTFSVDDNLQCYSFGKYFKNLFILSQKIYYKKDVVIDYFSSILKSEKLNDFTKYSLMEFIVASGKNIEVTTKKLFFDYSKNKIEHLEESILEAYLKLLVHLSQKLNISPNEFHEKLGDYHISQLEKQNNKGFIAHHYYTNALEEYKKANIKEKIEQTSVLLEQAKKSIDLKKTSISSDDNEEIQDPLNQWWDFTKNKINNLIINGKSKDIFAFLIVENLFPQADKLSEEKRPTILDFVTTLTFDINKNVNKNNKSSGVNFYSLHINNFSLRQIWLVFSEGIKNAKISFESLIEYLEHNSWYSNDFTYLDTNNETQGFNWIELISPSLQSFFIQCEIDIKTMSNNPQGYILAIDSLVIKFEGLLREFSRMIGAQTIEIKDNSTEERISFDKLLDNEKLQSIIPPDDIAYFKFLFTSDGINLRNNVAHSFFTTKNYTNGTMLLLIVALLRLGNYKLTPNG